MAIRFTAAALALALSALGSAAYAADPHFQNVAVLTARDRVSLVFELTDEPKDVATRRVSAAVLELDAGPIVMPAKATSFMAPPGVRFVMGVSLQAGDGTTPGRLKARITLLERARSAVRVVGRRVYVDFSPDSLPVASEPERTSAARPAARPVPAIPAQAPAAAAPAASPSAAENYRTTVQPAIERFEQLTPFMVSAAASPSESVLKAVGNTLIGIQGLLLSVDVPAEARQTHDLLSSAVATAVTAVSPSFTGDRPAHAKQALVLLEQAKSIR
ncbi:MAG: hypothetical protein ACRD3G_14135 [Vicinamibacterales bacterium]